ncbi:MAG: hypothetical protein M1168_00305 [Candidatus Marsarchaeota archaeon]|nr:hypothetical protein [Candidatus Marsarchaeota archaeon]MCL5094413.1 hypothetical protein [Candidatus Marsarchaeota archaeon]
MEKLNKQWKTGSELIKANKELDIDIKKFLRNNEINEEKKKEITEQVLYEINFIKKLMRLYNW